MKASHKGMLVAAAVAGLVIAGSAHADHHEAKGADAAKGECHGVNECKGTGACGGDGHACAGKNACKGKGWLKLTKAECDAKKGTFKAKGSH